jgi:hypothetical protein
LIWRIQESGYDRGIIKFIDPVVVRTGKEWADSVKSFHFDFSPKKKTDLDLFSGWMIKQNIRGVASICFVTEEKVVHT